MKKTILLICIVILCISCKKDDDAYEPVPNALDLELVALLENISEGQGIAYFELPSETDFANIPQDPLNPITAEKVALGQLLVHETATGGNPKMEINRGMYSCATCHPAAASFFSAVRKGISEGGSGFGIKGEGRVKMPSNLMPNDSIDALPVKVPTLLNVAYQEVALWNGSLGGAGINAPFVAQNAEDFPENLLGFQGLEVQGMIGQTAHRLKIDEEFATQFGYKPLFDAAYPEVPVSERYSSLNGALAIAAFNRTVLANQAPWQEWLRGNSNALTDKQKRGAVVFFDKGKCYECHTGPALKSNEFYAFGMGDLNLNSDISKSFRLNPTKGRGEFTGIEEDFFKFKVPTLYNLKDTPFYGHGGTFNTIQQVIEYKNNGEKENNAVPDSRLAIQFGNLNLTEADISNLTDFIENGLFDPNVARYAPESVLSGNCIPSNDAQARIDLGCD
ncbi:cytochrome-c peroxidase [Cochleicola gelatinilyticus]|uniref:Cytochrome-c peroxidase n=1 Tax=Cochleicola gelatinilyticus TaxID=1763537 RepID=A0A167HFL2_9FLAO|nr:cytochrome c peroxidase [Cochleicola gelatinilyticus]OAB78553.1 cytochrome-c peroxidase [Cochleicola gelatinilyticus]